ncbi:MAG TPA: PQQ-dependent sugar dehydrogenase [Candidatus Limnocylindrales bacterium]|nr:PQQ-dependent sugar dehydrogenase [Candidatus Limnocylindrales bacterium]
MIRYALRLSLFTLVALIVVAGTIWMFRGQVLRFAGMSFDTGAAGETAVQSPEGLASGVFASGLLAPRFMAVSRDGILFVAERGADRVVALPDRDRDGRADETVVVGAGYDAAHSLAFAPDGTLLVAGSGTLFEVTLDGSLHESGRRAILSYPSGGSHTTRTVLVAPDGSLLVSVGSSCNVCWETDERRAAILQSPAGGGSWRMLMTGLRNAVGVAIDPETGSAWATNNGRDLMGDDTPPETLYRVVDGADAGWPRCHASVILDPEFGAEPDPRTGLTGCQGVVAPAATFQAHAAPLGITFWRDHAVIAFHGSWNRSTKVGYEVLWLPWDDGPAGAAEVLAGGFLDAATGDASGRPAGVIVGGDGALYLSDDKGGFIYRISPSG